MPSTRKMPTAERHTEEGSEEDDALLIHAFSKPLCDDDDDAALLTTKLASPSRICVLVFNTSKGCVKTVAKNAEVAPERKFIFKALEEDEAEELDVVVDPIVSSSSFFFSIIIRV